MGPAGDYREPARRRTKPRRGGCRQGGARRLHAACHAAGPARDQSAFLSEARFRSGGIRSGHDHGRSFLYSGRQPESSRVDPARADCLCESQPGQAQLRIPLGPAAHRIWQQPCWPPPLASAVHVPYKGLVPAMTDLLAGHVDMMFDNLGNTLSHIKDCRLRVLAISTEKRIPEFPEVPAVAEMYPGVVYTSWFAIVAPPKTPPEIASKLSSAINEVLRMPDVAKRLKAMSTTPGGQSPAQTAALFAEESQRWRKVIASAGIKAE